MPHRWHVIGWSAIAFWLVMLVVYFIAWSVGADFGWIFRQNDVGQVLGVFLGQCMPYLALIIVCLSREKVEDEYIQHQRSLAVFLVVIALFTGSMLTWASQNLLYMYGYEHVYMTMKWWWDYFMQMPVAAVLYIVLFKGMLLFNRIRSRENG